MTNNEIDEWRFAQLEKCASCFLYGVGGCLSNKGQQMDIPPEDKHNWGAFQTALAHDDDFCEFAKNRACIRECWRPVVATSACVGYVRNETR